MEGVAQSSAEGAEPTEVVRLRRQAVLAWSGERVRSECGRTCMRAPRAEAPLRERSDPVAPPVCVSPRGWGPWRHPGVTATARRRARRKHQRCARAAATDACVVPSASSVQARARSNTSGVRGLRRPTRVWSSVQRVASFVAVGVYRFIAFFIAFNALSVTLWTSTSPRPAALPQATLLPSLRVAPTRPSPFRPRLTSFAASPT